MWKYRYRIVLISSLLLVLCSETALTQSRTSNAQSGSNNAQVQTTAPQGASPQNPLLDEPFCFIQMSDGRVVNLQKLCGTLPPPPPVSKFRRNCRAMKCATGSQLNPVPPASDRQPS
ncbi:hypothetical protein BST81_13975 [Leptolyngbya sp. 'hensonii']|uniref:hypothetical protein n=1 Tax=Leptolyngbya sp. 'hensonii' TaxID=1922337 RepID=UPI00094F81B3|nr:hypothetical protein [Leptolyngbya sp. 'hensonii']OLP18124.1 hypothetical protein BST81_13975 [Leptolyngbya sp. 'hensonii']